MRRWHAETNPQHLLLPDAVACALEMHQEQALSIKPVPGRRT